MGMTDNPNLFVTSGGAMSGGQIYLDLFDITRRFISEQGREGPNIPGCGRSDHLAFGTSLRRTG
jgi:hypothetical protein